MAGAPLGPADARRVRLGLGVLAAAALLYEIALTRLSSVLLYTHLTSVVIAACLAALGLGAAYAHRRAAAGRLEAGFLPRSAAWASASGALALPLLTGSPAGFALGIFGLPLFWTGAYAGAAYVLIGRRPGLTYAAEVAGGAAGALLAPLLLPRFGDVTTAAAAAALAGAGALPVLSRGAGPSWGILPAPVVLALSLALPGGPVSVDPYAEFGFRPHLVEQTRARGGRVVATAYDSYARTDLVATDEPWVRYIYTDRMYAARVARWDGRSPRFADPELVRLSRLKEFPFRAGRPRRVLVLGAGGGFDVALALQSGAESVDAVEVNAAIVRFTRSLSSFCGSVYDRPEVRVHRAEARAFLRATDARWDVIDLSLMQTDPASLRSNAGVQSWVFTVEAIAEYLGHLAPGGLVAVVQNTRPMAERTCSIALRALERMGLAPEEARGHLMVLALPASEQNPFNHLVLLGRERLAGDRLAALVARAGEAGLLVLGPGGAAGDAGLGGSAGGARPALDPPTDDRPVFYELQGLLSSLYRTLVFLAVGLFLAALARDRFVASGSTDARLAVRGWLTAGSLGAAFMLAQSGLIDRAQFLLGEPGLAVCLVVGGMLLFSAAGGALGSLLGRVAPGRRLAVAAASAGALLAAEASLSGALPRLLGRADLATQTAALMALLAAVAVPAGLCLPACMERFAARAPGAAAAVYTADGLAAVVGAAGGSLLAMQLGISRLFLAAGAAYAVAAVAGGGDTRDRPERLTGPLRAG